MFRVPALPTVALAACLLTGCDDLLRFDAGDDTRIVGRASVTDGDTFEVRGQRIRLWGVDAPESKQRCHRPDGDEWRCGTEAANALADWIGPRTVTCERRGKSYDRVVAQCEVGGEDVGEWLVRRGWALDYKRYSKGEYGDEERAAARDGAGMHAGTFQTPWEYRASRRKRRS
ncbi:thermonuclease family protein [Cognatilysobacter bugurensis]|nr:thermonuclease family protein [Lysobacter bugurensis]